MKKTLLITLQFLFFCQVALAQDFKTTWLTYVGSISFGVTTTGPVSYTWQTLAPATPASGSGTFTGPNVTISGLPNVVEIQLSIQPQNFSRFISDPGEVQTYTPYEMRSVNQWGAVAWTSMENAFRFSDITVVNASDIPNLSGVTSLAGMFSYTFINSPFNINAWNVSNITNMSGMFKECYNFNQSLSLWNTANVTDMSSMFENATAFNLNIGNWNTSNVTNMSKMFKEATNFNKNIGNWNTSNVTNMSEMFGIGFAQGGYTSIFNQDISGWNTASVTNMSGMFRSNQNFNQNISSWNTSNVTNMSEMFQNAVAFNQNIGSWNTANVTNMAGMFSGVNFYAGEIMSFSNAGNSSIQNWNTANVTDMSRMFFNATNFNQNLGNWALNTTVNLTEMLDSSGLNCVNYSQTLISWNNNPNTPNNKILGATFLEYGLEAVSAVNNLTFAKGWGFSGHDMISLNPTFNFQTAYCQGAVIPALPLISVNGVSGTWSPELNNLATTTYTFTPNLGQCALSTTRTININVNSNIIPSFNPIVPQCSGTNFAALPTTSTNGITGTWSPALNNLTTTTYTFTPNTGQCATTTTLTITVNPSVTPNFATVAPICSGGTLAALPTTSSNGITGTWSPSLNNTTTTTYTFTPNSGQCATTTTLTIAVNQSVTPNFTTVAPICSNGTLAALPTTSTNGITGTWSPSLNNTTTTTYTFTPNSGQCATTTTLTIAVNQSVTPNFTTVAPICSNGTLAALPTTSTNGITGTWSPSLNNTTTTTYTFTPNSGQCASVANLIINVNQIELPSGNINQTFNLNSTIANIVISPNNVLWYATLSDALANVNSLSSNTLLTDDTTYFAVNDNGLCRSQPFAVTVDVTLGISSLNKKNLKIYPNPVTSILQISYNNTINSVEIYSVLGQLLISKRNNSLNYTIDMSQLPSSLYLIKIISENQTGEFKILKQ